MSLLAFVAHQLAERTKTVTIIESRSRKDSFSVQPSRTLSEKPAPGNYCVKVDRLALKPMAVAGGQVFLPRVARKAKFPEQQSDDVQRVEDNTFHPEEARSMS
jgi:hypothetical protein